MDKTIMEQSQYTQEEAAAESSSATSAAADQPKRNRPMVLPGQQHQSKKSKRKLTPEEEVTAMMTSKACTIASRSSLEAERWTTASSHEEEDEERRQQNQQILASYLLDHAHGATIDSSQTQLITAFARVLGNSSVTIERTRTRSDAAAAIDCAEKTERDTTESGESIGTLSIYQRLNSGVITAPLDALFEETNTDVRALHASLAWLNTCTAATVVKLLRTFSEETIMKIVDARFIAWKLILDGSTERVCEVLIPKGELEHLKFKAQHEEMFSEAWIRAMIKPMQCYLRTADGEWSVSKHSLHLELNRRKITDVETFSPDEIQEQIISPMESLFCYFAKHGLLARATQKEYYRKRLKGLNFYSSQEQQNGSRSQYRSAEYWYFRKR